MDMSLGHVQVGYSGTSEMRPVGSVIFQPLKCKQAVWKRCKNCKLLLMLLMGHKLLFASIAVSVEISNLSLCRNYFLCERSHKDDGQAGAGRVDGCVCQRILMCAFENESWSTSLLLEDWCELQGCGVEGHMRLWRPGIPEYVSVWFNFNIVYNAPRKDN